MPDTARRMWFGSPSGQTLGRRQRRPGQGARDDGQSDGLRLLGGQALRHPGGQRPSPAAAKNPGNRVRGCGGGGRRRRHILRGMRPSGREVMRHLAELIELGRFRPVIARVHGRAAPASERKPSSTSSAAARTVPAAWPRPSPFDRTGKTPRSTPADSMLLEIHIEYLQPFIR